MAMICFFVLFIFAANLLWQRSKPSGFGFISDIHAGREKKLRRDENDIVYPKRYKICLESEISSFKKEKIPFMIALGDSTNKNEEKYFNSLKDIAKKEKFEILWVKGNHDYKIFQDLNGDSYYSADRNQWRIIVLDSTGDTRDGDGRLTEEQITFLKEKMDTKKRIIVAMHHPIFFRTNPEVILPQYREFYEIVRGKAEYVLFGHWHQAFSREIDGTKFIVQTALSEKDSCHSAIVK